jgi:hypothetical protein
MKGVWRAGCHCIPFEACTLKAAALGAHGKCQMIVFSSTATLGPGGGLAASTSCQWGHGPSSMEWPSRRDGGPSQARAPDSATRTHLQILGTMVGLLPYCRKRWDWERRREKGLGPTVFGTLGLAVGLGGRVSTLVPGHTLVCFLTVCGFVCVAWFWVLPNPTSLVWVTPTRFARAPSALPVEWEWELSRASSRSVRYCCSRRCLGCWAPFFPLRLCHRLERPPQRPPRRRPRRQLPWPCRTAPVPVTARPRDRRLCPPVRHPRPPCTPAPHGLQPRRAPFPGPRPKPQPSACQPPSLRHPAGHPPPPQPIQ